MTSKSSFGDTHNHSPDGGYATCAIAQSNRYAIWPTQRSRKIPTHQETPLLRIVKFLLPTAILSLTGPTPKLKRQHFEEKHLVQGEDSWFLL